MLTWRTFGEDAVLKHLRQLVSVEGEAATGKGLSRSSPKMFARGMHVFDCEVHKDIRQLPILLLQQYTSPNLSKCSSLPNEGVVFRRGDIICDSTFAMLESEQRELNQSAAVIDITFQLSGAVRQGLEIPPTTTTA